MRSANQSDLSALFLPNTVHFWLVIMEMFEWKNRIRDGLYNAPVPVTSGLWGVAVIFQKKIFPENMFRKCNKTAYEETEPTE